jgi:UDP-N-acetylglucosamine--N-acetylmuramyl-(pentapeptide) pyrophosphoryl-undecaprenol N-acetylglucosamine transferase
VIAPIRRPTLVFAGGGSGGHLYPALAVARALEGVECVFLVPADRGDGARVAAEFRTIAAKAPRLDREPLLYPVRLLRSIVEARRALRRVGACGVVGLGGYASVPACLAARSLALPVYLMELNAVPGRATRMLARLACGVGLGSAAALPRMHRRVPCRITGTPLREELQERADPRDFGLDPGLPTLLVLGGSQGAWSLNTRVTEAMTACADLPMQVLHCAGVHDAPRVREAYRATRARAVVLEFLPRIGRAYSVADLVLARGGASTVAECLALGLPAVYVPYPHHKDRQQAMNALVAVRAGAARLVEEDALTPEVFRALALELLLRPSERRAMAEAARALALPGAAEAMAAHLMESLGAAMAEPRWLAEIGG